MSAFNFGAHFQLHFAAFMLRDTGFLARVFNVVQPEFFTDETLQRIVRLVLAHYIQYKTAPDTLIFQELDRLNALGKISDDLKKTLSIYVDEMLYRVKLQNREYLESQFEQFAWNQKLESELLPLTEAIKQQDRKSVNAILRKMLQEEKVGELHGSNFTANPEARVIRRLQEESDCLYFGIPELDLICPPLKRGEIMLWQSKDSSSGKTAALVHVAKASLFQNYNVLIATLEESSQEFEDKLDQSMSGLTRSELTNAEKIHRQVSRFLSRGSLHIAEFVPGSTTVDDLKKYVSALKSVHNFYPDVVLLDYADKLNCGDNNLSSNISLSQERIYFDFEAWLKTDNLFGHTAAQSGRSASASSSDGKRYADQSDVGGSLKKIHIAHRVISINPPKEAQDNDKLFLNVTKNRGGIRNVLVQIPCDFSRMCFYVNKGE